MTKKNGFILGFLALVLTTCGEAPPTEIHFSCTPSFLEVFDKPVRLDLAYWKIYFSVALVGCEESLRSLTQAELRTITIEFKEPTEWFNFLLFADSTKPEFRDKAVAKVNSLVGRQVVTDILVHDLTLIDYQTPLTGQ
jgi:hypothetical protein